jgi:hypothetical protein
MTTRRLNQAKSHSGSDRGVVHITVSSVAGVLWGVGWGLCVETYQSNNGLSFLGYTLTPLQVFVLGIVAAAFALTTLTFMFHAHRPFWRPLFGALIAAFIAAILFYLVLGALAVLLPHVGPSALEEFLLPLGWSIENAVLFIALQKIDRPRPLASRPARRDATARRFVECLLFLLGLSGLWLFFLVTRSFLSTGVMLTVVPPIVWTALALIGEPGRNVS